MMIAFVYGERVTERADADVQLARRSSVTGQ